MPNAGTEQLAENGDVKMSMDALPAATLKVVPAELFFGFTKTDFDDRASECDAQQRPHTPASSPWYPIAEEVFGDTGKHIGGNDQRALPTDELSVMRFTPTDVPANFPDLRPRVFVDHAITLSGLIAKARRIAVEIFNLVTSLGLA